MLTVGTREDGKKGLGLGLGLEGGGRGGGLMMEEDNELEEGEAYSGQEDDSCIDPDSFSYIDVKLNDVLGHLRKDFEGGVSAENLGAKYGGYGSFLPTYQRSPCIFSQSRSPKKLASHNAVQSPYNAAVEGLRQCPLVTATSRSNTTGATALNNSAKKDNCRITNNGDPISQHNSNNKSVSGGNETSSLKVRLRLGPENNLCRDKAAIYSGLGLDMSPSSSYEDSPDGSAEISPEYRGLHDESPKTIIQIMTCFSTPGGFLLSPLQDSLICLIEKDDIAVKNCQVRKSMPILRDLTLPGVEVKIKADKKIKSGEKKGRLTEVRDSRGKDDIGKILQRDIDIETPTGQELVSNALNIALLSGSRSDEEADGLVVGNVVNYAGNNLGDSRKLNRVMKKDRMVSSNHVSKKQLDMTETITNNGPGNFLDTFIDSRRQVTGKQSITLKPFEAQSTNNYMNASCSSSQRNCKSKTEKEIDMYNSHSESSGYKTNNEQYAELAYNSKQTSSRKISSHEVGGEYVLGKDQTSDSKRKVNVNHRNSEQLREASKDNSSGNLSAVLKEQGKSSHATSVRAPHKVKTQKSFKELNGPRFRESHVDVIGDTNVEQMDAAVFPSDSHSKGKQKTLKSHPEKEPIVSSKMGEKSSGKRVVDTSTNGVSTGEPLSAPSLGNGPSTEAVVGTQAPLVIEEVWVRCDICHKWRLLPYGTNPNDLPKTWECRMLNWLPGMNSCSISEDETTRALNAMYAVPPPAIGDSLNSHHGVAIPNASSGSRMHVGQNTEVARNTAPATGKKKSLSRDASNGQCQSFQAQIPVFNNQQTLNKLKSSNDAYLHSSETNSSNKGGSGISSKSMALYTDKQKQRQKDKHKVDARFPDGGHLVGKSGKHSSSKSKRELHGDDPRVPKKAKKESPLYPSRDWHSSNVIAEKAYEDSSNEHLAKTTTENRPGHNQFPSVKDLKLDLKAKSSKKSKDHVRVSYKEGMEEHFSGSDVERSGHRGFSTQKRKLMEWQESQIDAEALVVGHDVENHRFSHEGTINENELVKDKKVKLSKSDGKMSRTNKMDVRMDKKDKATKIMLPVNTENLPRSVEDDAKYVGKERELSQWQGDRGYRRDLDFDSLKRDAGYAQASGAANSSSSKVSGSHRSKTNYQEPKGSPVESVSSSPLRLFNMETFPSKRLMHENEAKIANPSGRGSSKRCSDGVSNRSGKGRKESAFPVERKSSENHMATDSSLRGTHAYKDKDKNQLFVVKSAKDLHSKSYTHDEHIPTELGNANVVGYASNLVDEQHKHLNENASREDAEELDKNNKHQILNLSNQRKSDKNSSGSKERSRGSKYEVDAGKLKVSSSFIENRDTRYPENGCNDGNELDRSFHENATIPESLRNEIHIQDTKIKKDCFEKKSSTSDWLAGKSENSSSLARRKNSEPIDHSALPNLPKAPDSRPPAVGGRFPKSYMQDEYQVASSQNREKAHNNSSDKIDWSKMVSEKSRSQINLPLEDKSATLSQGHGIEKCGVDGVNNEGLKLVKRSRQSDGPNGLHHNTLRHSTPGGPDSSSPMRKDVHSSAMKEARDLKHTANRLKNEGLEFESTALYFEAALKFLHCASLMEPTQGEAAQMYSETARLCEFVAHEYEKLKEMAAAALAYKCVEVAYLKAAYWKNSNASKDRHDLQIALQILPPGESPSSSASDVDNLNHQSTLGKTASAKGVNSPQVGNNHVIAARLHPQVLRLLHYTNDLNCAFEATRKSQIAIAAASVNLTKDTVDSFSSIRKVLDFNFHNVEGLLRLVRLSKESIGR